MAMIEEPAESKAPLASRVRDYMTPEPQSLGVGQTLLDAVLMIRLAYLRHIPILEDGRLVGVLSDRDVHRLAPSLLIPHSSEEYNRVFADTPLEKVMTRNPITISPDAPLVEAVNLLFKERLGCLPVLDEGKLVGIITVSDMLRALYDLVSLTSSSPPSSSPASSKQG
jgi:acetoin utilization protein AcuB